MGMHFDMIRLKQLSDVFARQIGTIIMSNGRIKIQIPIDCRLFQSAPETSRGFVP